MKQPQPVVIDGTRVTREVDACAGRPVNIGPEAITAGVTQNHKTYYQQLSESVGIGGTRIEYTPAQAAVWADAERLWGGMLAAARRPVTGASELTMPLFLNRQPKAKPDLPHVQSPVYSTK